MHQSLHQCSARRKNSLGAILRNREGAVAVTTALLLVILVGFAALGLEITSLYLQRHRMQAAADVAVVGAGVASRTTSQAVGEAIALAGQAGYVNGSNGVKVTFNKPPASGTFATGAAEVIIEKSFKPRLLSLFLTQPIAIKVRAVSIPGRRSPGCIFALDTSGSGAITIRNNSSIFSAKCELVSNSTSQTALILENSAKIYGSVFLLGNYQLGQNSALLGLPVVVNGTPAVDDPYATVLLPTAPGCTTQSATMKGTVTLDPGRFCSGMTIDNRASVTLKPGVYFVDGPLSLGNNSTVTGTGGVTLLLNSAPNVTVAAGVTLSLTAPTTGATAGMAIASQRNVTGVFAINNAAKLKVEGAIYLPGMTATISGNATTSGNKCTQLIAHRLDLGSDVELQADCGGTAVRPIGHTQPILVH